MMIIMMMIMTIMMILIMKNGERVSRFGFLFAICDSLTLTLVLETTRVVTVNSCIAFVFNMPYVLFIGACDLPFTLQ